MNDTPRHKPEDPRPGMRFTTETPLRDADPQPAHHFSGEVSSRALTPTENTEPTTRADPAAALGRPRKRRWGLLGVMAGTMGLGAAELVSGLPASLTGGDWLSAGWQLLGLGVIGLGGLAILRELWRLRRLGRHHRLREALAELPECSPQQAMALARRLKTQLDLHDDHPHWQAFLEARQPHHDGNDLAPLLAHHLLGPRDREARRLISRMNGETAIMVAVSPLTLVDMGLVAWRHLAMIDRLCRLYGLELGYAARVRLLRDVFRQMAFAGATELASDAGMQMLSMDLAGRLSTRAAQGLGVGLLGARLGLRTQQLTRPLTFTDNEQPRLNDLRRELWQQLRRIDDKGANPRE
ncbi:TIGR01620 family protein [Halomonas sp. 18H]|uniref:TIGR01620 family protein n=1 Tax=Halomonas almeriensis TaxID=308163 RepID=UPI00222FB688|nr:MULTISPECIES: TIGR01620 family protein [Halomonas]MCW4149161.1 TIGR01620 family protein [Halomonas sp. 18H]MDN3552289.1 TIGR01620 family protein [Halomonas almeriensis]